MSLNPFAIAVQGVGYGPLLVSVQGLYPIEAPEPPPPYTPPLGGGAAWGKGKPRKQRLNMPADVIDFSQQNEVIIGVVVIAVTSGMLE